jgi:hypothetical protein
MFNRTGHFQQAQEFQIGQKGRGTPSRLKAQTTSNSNKTPSPGIRDRQSEFALQITPIALASPVDLPSHRQGPGLRG